MSVYYLHHLSDKPRVTCDAVQVAKPAPAAIEAIPVTGEKRRAVFPNPAAQNVTVRYAVKDCGKVLFTLSDMSGKVLKIAIQDELSTETHETSFDVSSLSAGSYMLQAACDGFKKTTKLTVIP